MEKQEICNCNTPLKEPAWKHRRCDHTGGNPCPMYNPEGCQHKWEVGSKGHKQCTYCGQKANLSGGSCQVPGCRVQNNHAHCSVCNFPLPINMVFLGLKEPKPGEQVVTAAGFYAVECPGCKSGNVIQIKATSN